MLCKELVGVQPFMKACGDRALDQLWNGSNILRVYAGVLAQHRA
jgi:hypothetical protein